MPKRNNIPFYGELSCDAVVSKTGKPCENGAYYHVTDDDDDSFRCGVHSHKDKRQKLAKDPDGQKKRIAMLKAHHDQCLQEAKERRTEGTEGAITMEKMNMMRSPPIQAGVYHVFPNFKHGGRKDGFGCRTLSPKFLGPVVHGQPGLPDAKNIENFHQGNKVFQHEVGDDGKARPCFFELQEKMYLDDIPHRHKPGAEGVRNDDSKGSKKNKNVPCFSVWVAPDGTKHHLTYFQSRQFYCTFYERLATQQDEFKELRKMHQDGININIVGYDAYPIDEPATPDVLMRCYRDVSRPFGHELVLFSLLVLNDPSDYPWRKCTEFKF